MEKRQQLTDNEKVNFFETSKKHCRAFLLFDQINKKLGDEIYQLQKKDFFTAISFEVEKIKTYFSVLNKIEKLEQKLYVFGKAFIFLYFIIFFLKKTKKTKPQIKCL